MPSATTTESEVLDNLIWHSLAGPHARFAEGDGPARRYHPDVAIFVAVEHGGADAWAALAELVGPGETVTMSGPVAATAPVDWDRTVRGFGYQMVLRRPAELAAVDPELRVEELVTEDVPQMLALVELAQPGPFRPRTIELGRYIGVFDDDHLLIALAGERMHADGYTEISAVATHPSARRRGIAAQLTSNVARGILERGETPLLHVAGTNDNAKRVYDRLGFEVRRTLEFAAVVTPGGAP